MGIVKSNIKEEKHMKATGIIRRVDELGRVVIPIEIRNQFNIVEKDQIEIYVDNSSIVLRKYEPNCVFCGNTLNTKALGSYRLAQALYPGFSAIIFNN